MSAIKSAVSLLTVLCLFAAQNTAQATIVPDNGLLNFVVMRDGKEIGTHVLSFRQTNDVIDVKIKTRITVTVAFITVYRFEHDGHEVWRNGKLERMETRTHDDGTEHTLRVRSNGSGKLRVVGDGTESVAEQNAVPASLWNPGFLKTNSLMNSLVGTPLDIKTAYRGEETVQVRGESVKAKHYSLSGELQRELWYDRNWVLVRLALKGKDGSDVEYVLK